MWKWTDNENIKAVILDVDSLSDEHIYYSFEEDIPGIKVFEVSKTTVYPTGNHIAIEYYDTIQLLYEILGNYSLKSFEIVAISTDTLFLKDMMQNHIGTILINELDKEQLKFTPDYTNGNLTTIFSNRNSGYGAEVIASGLSTITKKVLLKCNSVVELSNGVFKDIQLFFGGRYYPKSRSYILDDPLTEVLLDFKKRYNKKVDQYYDGALNLLNKVYSIDVLTYVPMKPEDLRTGRFDRFESLQLNQIKSKGIYLQNILKCHKDFSQKHNDALHRSENVKGAYSVLADVNGKNVVVLDDLFSTGNTINEIARVLYENGAKNVMAVFLAVNQMTESTVHPYKRIECPRCKSDMRLIVTKENNLFFGCTNFPNCDYKLDKDIGLQKIKEINQITIEDVFDLEDIY